MKKKVKPLKRMWDQSLCEKQAVIATHLSKLGSGWVWEKETRHDLHSAGKEVPPTTRKVVEHPQEGFGVSF
jgi:hypothetical protein